MMYGITVGEVLVAHGDCWDAIATSMHWWIREATMTWRHNSGAERETGWNEAAEKSRAEWSQLKWAFDMRTRLIYAGVAHPLWSTQAPSVHSEEGLPLRVGRLSDAEFERLPFPGRLARVTNDSGEIQKVKIVSHNVGMMTSTVQITSRKNMPKGAARRVITVPWPYVLAR